MSSTMNLGIVTAYRYAQEKGFTGTENEFAEMLANVVQYRNDAQSAQSGAQAAEDNALRYAGNASDSAGAAAHSADEAEHYADLAFSTTPDGYEALVLHVNAVDARVDEIVNPTASSVTLDAEVQDIRIGANGTNYGSAGTAVRSQILDLNKLLDLRSDELPDTVQEYEFSGGTVSQVTHTRNNETIRTDDFTYTDSTIIETRTLSTGEVLEIETDLSTLETTVTYTAA